MDTITRKPQRVGPSQYRLELNGETWLIWHGGRWNARYADHAIWADTLSSLVRRIEAGAPQRRTPGKP